MYTEYALHFGAHVNNLAKALALISTNKVRLLTLVHLIHACYINAERPASSSRRTSSSSSSVRPSSKTSSSAAHTSSRARARPSHRDDVYDSDEYDEYESEEEDVRPSRGSSSRRGYGKGAVVVVSARGRGSRGPPAKPRFACNYANICYRCRTDC
jgi:hypothetical protein